MHRPAERGFMLWHPKTGAHPSYGAIRQCHGIHGYEGGRLGYPVTDEQGGGRGCRWQQFEDGIIYWSPSTGAHAVWGAMLEHYTRDGRENGKWGLPIGPEKPRPGGGWEQAFQGGVMTVGVPRTPAVPQVSENDPKQWIRMRGGEGWGCVCMAITLPLIEADMKRRGLISECIDIYQFAYNAGGVKASAGTHDAGGVIDVGQFSKAQREVWADWGVLMFPRTAQYGWNGAEHGHGVWHGCVHRTASAAQQVRDGLAGYDGLVSHTYRDFIKPTRTWQDAVRASR